MIRLFVAVDLPERIQPYVENLGQTLVGARPVPPEQMHLTLKFIGEVESGLVADIRECLHTVRAQPFTMRLQGVGYFPPRGAPKVVWAGVEPQEGVLRLRNSVEKSLRDTGLPRDKKKFFPHLTLCRLKNSPPKKVARFLETNALLVTPYFEVEHFTLYSSVLTPKGAIHTVVDTVSLLG